MSRYGKETVRTFDYWHDHVPVLDAPQCQTPFHVLPSHPGAHIAQGVSALL
jgi:hypothetical protein